MDDLLKRFKLETGETNDDLVSSFINSAKATVLSKTNRKELITELEEATYQLALSRYYKRGNTGLSSYSEGGENESYLSEDEILSGINSYRLCPLGRRVKNENEQSEEVQN